MSDLFDLPFEEEDSPDETAGPIAPDAPVAANVSPAPRGPVSSAGPRAGDRPPDSHRHAADNPRPRSAGIRTVRGVGRRRALELPDLEHRPSVLHPERHRRAGARRDFPVGAPLSEVQAGRRHARGGTRAPVGVRAQRRVSARLRAPRASGARRAAAGVRSTEAAASRRRPVRRRPQAAAAGAASEDRDRHLARRGGDSRHHQGAGAGGTPTRISSFVRRASRARGRRSTLRAA